MSIYDLFIYDKYGQCLYHRPMNQVNVSQKTFDRRSKLVFGLLYTMQAFVNKLTPVTLTEQENEPIICLNTPTYRIHTFTTLSGFRIVLTTNLKLTSVTNQLKRIYGLFVDYVVSTPYYGQGETLSAIPIVFDKQIRSFLDTMG